jgi:putative endonuclease
MKKSRPLSPYKIGIIGENRAVTYLKKKKYKIVQRGYRHGKGEIDIIAVHRHILVFIEVKTRRDTNYGNPEEQVSIKKQKQIKKTAAGFLRQNDYRGFPCRFDVLAMIFHEENDWKIHHFQNAFE